MKSRQRPNQEPPQRKISETFLDFADPIVETLPEDASAAVEKVVRAMTDGCYKN